MADVQHRNGLHEANEDVRRLIVDDVPWLVYEWSDRYDRRQQPSLIFETDQWMRRVRNYPADWRVLTDAELISLSLTT